MLRTNGTLLLLLRSVCLSAAIYFKRVIELNWETDENENKENGINVQDRNLIKENLVTFMCSVPAKIQLQFSQAISIISKKDFPSKWANLLPNLVARLGTPDLAITTAVLKTASAIFKRFRGVAKTDANLGPLKISLTQFQEPLLKVPLALLVVVYTYTSIILVYEEA